jgi:hypothetical protein
MSSLLLYRHYLEDVAIRDKVFDLIPLSAETGELGDIRFESTPSADLNKMTVHRDDGTAYISKQAPGVFGAREK